MKYKDDTLEILVYLGLSLLTCQTTNAKQWTKWGILFKCINQLDNQLILELID